VKNNRSLWSRATPMLLSAAVLMMLPLLAVRAQDAPAPAGKSADAPAKPAAPVAPAAKPAKKKLTFEQVNTGAGRRNPGAPGAVRFNGDLPSYRWAPDGFHIEFDKGRGANTTTFWIDPETFVEAEAPADRQNRQRGPGGPGGRPRRGADADTDTGTDAGFDADLQDAPKGDDPKPADKPADKPAAPKPVDKNSAREAFTALLSTAEKLSGDDLAGALQNIRASADGSASVLKRGNALYFHRKGEDAKVLQPKTAAAFELDTINRDGSAVSFVRGGNLILISTADAKEHAVSKDGSTDILNGKLDWATQEEIYGRGKWSAKWFSPNGAKIAFLRLDQTKVKSFIIVDDIPDDPKNDRDFAGITESWKYPKAGEAIPTVKVGVASSTTGKTTWLDLSKYEKETKNEFLVVRVGWTPDSSKIVFQVQDRIQTYLDLNYADPATGAVTNIIHEASDCWVDVNDGLRWLKDGTFLWQSQRTGYNHLYHYKADGTLIAQVTKGEWSFGSGAIGPSAVDGIFKLDEDKGVVYFTGGEGGYWNDNLYRVNLDGTGFLRLTQGDGSHSPVFRKDEKLFLDTVTSFSNAGEARLCKADGTILKVLATATVPAANDYEMSTWEAHMVPCRDNYTMEVAVLKPTNFVEGKRYPVWCPIYLGPDLPNVSNSWNGSAWDQFLAQQGYIIMRYDGRCGAGKGRAISKACYKHTNVQELRDGEDAVDWICKTKGWGDPDRVGITGTSYGGTSSAYALTHSTKFALGFANAGLYDDAGYDWIYSERYMQTPQQNPEGYKLASCLPAAKNLHGYLVLTHGSMDENVHMQSMMRLVYALQNAGKQFEMMVYPENRHGVGRPAQRQHLTTLMWNTMQRVMPGGPKGEPKASSSTAAPSAPPVPADAAPPNAGPSESR
jgi:dipeptidyl-peptidase-4